MVLVTGGVVVLSAARETLTTCPACDTWTKFCSNCCEDLELEMLEERAAERMEEWVVGVGVG